MESNGPSKRKGSPKPDSLSKRAALNVAGKEEAQNSEAHEGKPRAHEQNDGPAEPERSKKPEESNSVSELRAAFGGFHPLAPLNLESLSRKASAAEEDSKEKPGAASSDQAHDEEATVQRSSSSASAIQNNFLTQVTMNIAGDNTFARLLSTFGAAPPGTANLGNLDPFIGVITPTASSAAPLPGLADPFAMSPIDAFRRHPSAEAAETFRRLASQDALDAFRRPASQDTMDAFRRPSNDAMDAFRRRPSLDALDAFRRNPSHDIDSFMRPPSQDILEPFRRRPSQDAALPSYFTGGAAGAAGIGDKYMGLMTTAGVAGMPSSLFTRTLSLQQTTPQEWQQQQLAAGQWPLVRAGTGGNEVAGVASQWPLARVPTGGTDGPITANWPLARVPTGGTDGPITANWPLTRTATGGIDGVTSQWPLARAPTGGTDALSQWPIARTATGGIDAAISAQWPLARAPTGGTDGLAAWPIARAATGGIDAALNGQWPLARVGTGGMDNGLGPATRRPEDLASLASMQQQNQFQLQLQFQLQQQLLQQQLQQQQQQQQQQQHQQHQQQQQQNSAAEQNNGSSAVSAGKTQTQATSGTTSASASSGTSGATTLPTPSMLHSSHNASSSAQSTRSAAEAWFQPQQSMGLMLPSPWGAAVLPSPGAQSSNAQVDAANQLTGANPYYMPGLPWLQHGVMQTALQQQQQLQQLQLERTHSALTQAQAHAQFSNVMSQPEPHNIKVEQKLAAANDHHSENGRSEASRSKNTAGEQKSETPTKRGARNRTVRWTREEHAQFLRGLELYGVGKWCSVARFCVLTRTPIQVCAYYTHTHIRVCADAYSYTGMCMHIMHIYIYVYVLTHTPIQVCACILYTYTYTCMC
jgi:hypothetical protein